MRRIKLNGGNTLVCLNVPPRTEFGLDYESFVTGERFKGVRHIPEGLHFIFFSNGTGGIRHGAFVNFTQPQEIAVKAWDTKQEWLFQPDASIDVENLKGKDVKIATRICMMTPNSRGAKF